MRENNFAAALQAYPVGAVITYFGDTPPTGWLFCYGQVLSITDIQYIQLYNAMGSLYNQGDEPTGTFRLPDCRGRVLVAVDYTSSGRIPSPSTLGSTQGNETEIIPSTGLAVHNHSGSSTAFDASHGHTISGMKTRGGEADNGKNNRGGGPHLRFAHKNSNRYPNTTSSGALNHSHSATSGVVSGGYEVAHNNIQQGLVSSFIIRYASTI